MHRKKLIAASLAACALAASSAAIAQGSSTKHASAKGRAAQAMGAPQGPGAGMPGGHAVHSVSVVLDKAGTGFITQTTDEGTIESVDSSAGTLTIVEGTKSVTYKTLTLDVPTGATVTLDGKASSLGALEAGDRVSLSTSSDGTTVSATDSSFQPSGGPGGGGPGMTPPAQGTADAPGA
jgi:hypothetical protein